MGVGSRRHMGVGSCRHMGVGSHRHMGVGSRRHMGVGSRRHMGVGSRRHMVLGKLLMWPGCCVMAPNTQFTCVAICESSCHQIPLSQSLMMTAMTCGDVCLLTLVI